MFGIDDTTAAYFHNRFSEELTIALQFQLIFEQLLHISPVSTTSQSIHSF